ncbi:MAG: glycine cleavage T C-terminal barrel domain-containing protein [Acidimicrobiales bacterium]
MPDAPLRTSPLDAAHRALDAKMVPFGGWDMPLQYPGGTIVEHKACRHGAVAFDVSHLGTVRVTGPDALDALQAALTNDLTKVGPGRAQYTHLLDPDDASVLDDIIGWWRSPEVFDVMPNASNTSRVTGALGVGTDVTAERAVIAVQGPEARERLAAVSPEAASVARFAVATVDWRGTDIVVAGTGYTGEDGVECAVPADEAPAFWQAVLDAGCGAGGPRARDTLRLEAALPLHGHELGPGILAAGPPRMGRGVAQGRLPRPRRPRGRARDRSGGSSTAWRPQGADRRAEQAVLLDGAEAGVITSGNFSPELGHGIALAFLPPGLDPGTELGIDVRSSIEPARIVATPFIPKR